MLVHNAGVVGEGDAGAAKSAPRRLNAMIKSFADNRDGNIIFLFAFMSTLLFLLAGGAVDFSRWNAVRADMVESMDSAGLAMAQIDALNGPEISGLSGEERIAYLKEQGEKFFAENFKHGSVVVDLNVDFDVTSSMITPTASGRIKTLFLGVGEKLLTGNGNGNLSYLQISSETEIVRRDDGNIEVALVLDVTGSMGGSRIDDLKTAAKEMVDIIVREDQEDWYSKLALVPYSMGVNVGAYRDAVSGSVPPGRQITNAVGKIGTAKNITNVQKLNPVRVTASSHGFANGDTVWISGVNSSGNLANNINNKAYTVSNRTTNNFRLQGVNGSGWSGTYSGSSGDFATECQNAQCEVLVTATSHGFSTNDYVHITGVNGMTQINNSVTNAGYEDDVWRITRVDNNNFRLQGSVGPAYSNYTSGGSAWCTTLGCEYYYFTNAQNNDRALRISPCVSERVGSHQYTDAAPSTKYVGRVYKSSGNTCPSAEIMPLSIDKAALKDSIDDYVASGSTAGQIGIAWGWYMLAPNFSYLFPADSAAAPYDDDETTKVIVIMTDGEFNTPYYNSVVARDAGNPGGSCQSNNGSGSCADKINQNSQNGDTYTQSTNLCDAMKDAGVIVYMIGFDISDSEDVSDMMMDCASGPDYVFFAATGDELKQIYRDIGSEITKLHIGK